MSKEAIGLVFGCVTGLAVLADAKGAEVITKTKPIDYVKVCSPYGVGFYYLPGTETCFRIGGALRIHTALNGYSFDAPLIINGTQSYFNRNYYSTYSRQTLFIDARTSTDYGVLRTYATMQFDWIRGRDNIAGGALGVDYVFIQFAGFTFGKAVSMFDPQWALGKPIISIAPFSGSNTATGINQLAYTATFNESVSATISLEDAQPFRTAGVINASAAFLGPFGPNGALGPTYGTVANSFVGNASGGDHVPDIVGNLRVDQAWGTLHFAAAAHEVHGTYYTATDSSTGHPNSTWGYAVSGAFELKNLPTGSGDSLKIEASFANGAAKYIFGSTLDQIGAGRYAVANGNTMGFGYVLDGIYTGTNSANGTGIEKSSAWVVDAYYEHYWNPAWRTSLFGSLSHIGYGHASNAAMLAAFNGPIITANSIVAGTAIGGGFGLNIAQLGTRTAWTPVQNLTLAAEFTYTRLDQNLTGAANITSVPGQTGSAFVMKDQNIYNGGIQIQRSF